MSRNQTRTRRRNNQRKRDLLKVHDDFKKRAAKRFRQVYDYGTGSDSRLFHASTISRMRNESIPTPKAQLIRQWLDYADRGLTEEAADMDLHFLRHAKRVIWSTSEPPCLKDVFVEAQRADLAEDGSELRVWAEGFSTGALEEHLRDAERDLALSERKVVAVRQELRRRRMEG